MGFWAYARTHLSVPHLPRVAPITVTCRTAHHGTAQRLSSVTKSVTGRQKSGHRCDQGYSLKCDRQARHTGSVTSPHLDPLDRKCDQPSP